MSQLHGQPMHGEPGQLSKPGASMPGHQQVADQPQSISQLPHRSRTGFRHRSCGGSQPSARQQRTQGVRAVAPAQAGGSEPGQGSGAASPALQGETGNLLSPRGGTASLRPPQALGTQGAVLSPAVCSPLLARAKFPMANTSHW